MTDELEAAREKRNRKQLADAVMSDLGVNAEGLAEIAETAPDEIRGAILDGLERQKAYRHFGRQHAAQDEALGIPGDRCCNRVCQDYQQSEKPDLEIPSESGNSYTVKRQGKQDFCKRGGGGWGPGLPF